MDTAQWQGHFMHAQVQTNSRKLTQVWQIYRVYTAYLHDQIRNGSAAYVVQEWCSCHEYGISAQMWELVQSVICDSQQWNASITGQQLCILAVQNSFFFFGKSLMKISKIKLLLCSFILHGD